MAVVVASATHVRYWRVCFTSCSGREPPVAIHLSSRTISPKHCQRSSGFLARQVRIVQSSAGGVIGSNVEIPGGCEDRIDAIRLAFDFPVNAGRPVAISYSTQP